MVPPDLKWNPTPSAIRIWPACRRRAGVLPVYRSTYLAKSTRFNSNFTQGGRNFCLVRLKIRVFRPGIAETAPAGCFAAAVRVKFI
jgi:hypothetical protein